MLFELAILKTEEGNEPFIEWIETLDIKKAKELWNRYIEEEKQNA